MTSARSPQYRVCDRCVRTLKLLKEGCLPTHRVGPKKRKCRNSHTFNFCWDYR